MKIQLTILGLGQIGTSIGLALAKYKDKILRIGHDKYRIAGNKAKDLDAIDNYVKSKYEPIYGRKGFFGLGKKKVFFKED